MANTDQKPIFISHASADREFVDRFVDLLDTGVGVSRDDMFCTSLQDMDVPPGENFVEFIKSQIQSPSLVLMIITENYLRSKFCLCEMGACWAMSLKGIPLLVEPIDFGHLDGVVTATQAIKMSDSLGMSRLKDLICELLELPHRSATWERKRDAFIDAIPKVPQTQQIIVSASDSVAEQPESADNIPDRLDHLIKYIEGELANLPNVSYTPEINRLLSRALTPLLSIHDESAKQGLPYDQLTEAISAARKVTNSQALLSPEDRKHYANEVVKLLQEQLRFLLSGI